MGKCSAIDEGEIGVISERNYSKLVNKTQTEVSDVPVERSCFIMADIVCVFVCVYEGLNKHLCVCDTAVTHAEGRECYPTGNVTMHM